MRERSVQNAEPLEKEAVAGGILDVSASMAERAFRLVVTEESMALSDLARILKMSRDRHHFTLISIQ